jgi:short-subunit dehydrogenase
MLLTRFALPAMLARNRGHIVNVASVAGLLPLGWGEVYAATKHGLVGFTRSLRTTLKVTGSGVRTSLICPGFIADIGMYADHATAHNRAPFLVGTSSSQLVVDAIVRSLQRGTAETIIGGWPLRCACATYNLAAAVGDAGLRLAGAHKVFMVQARSPAQRLP